MRVVVTQSVAVNMALRTFYGSLNAIMKYSAHADLLIQRADSTLTQNNSFK